MGEERRKSDWPVLVAALATIVLITFALYVVGYFFLAKTEQITTQDFADSRLESSNEVEITIRSFGSSWLAGTYKPAARVEELFTGRKVWVTTFGERFNINQ